MLSLPLPEMVRWRRNVYVFMNQFHQHFARSFFARKFWAQRFVRSYLFGKKCCWNWHHDCKKACTTQTVLLCLCLSWTRIFFSKQTSWNARFSVRSVNDIIHCNRKSCLLNSNSNQKMVQSERNSTVCFTNLDQGSKI